MHLDEYGNKALEQLLKEYREIEYWTPEDSQKYSIILGEIKRRNKLN